TGKSAKGHRSNEKSRTTAYPRTDDGKIDWSRVICKHCNRKDHPDTRCWTKYPHLRPKVPRRTEAEEIVVASELFGPKLRRSTSTGSKQGSEYTEDIYIIGSVTDGSGSIPVKALLDTGCQLNML
ncbi:hypothetical protein ADUPG1_005320, partial [Aduncisulcus paluster]